MSDFAARNRRWNIAALGIDFGLFMAGLSFISSATVLPAFAASLGASTLVIGAIPAVMTVGWFLPPLFAAAHTERLAEKLPFIMRWTAWERIPVAVFALVAFFVTERAPHVTLTLLLVMLLLITSVGGMLMPAWLDLVAHAVPTRLRGRFFGLSSFAGTIGGLGASALTAWALSALPSATAYALCFGCAGLAMGISWIALAVVREPPATMAPAGADFWMHLGSLPALLRRDRNFTLFLAARVLSFGGSIAAGFFTVYALRVLRAPESDVGVFTALLVTGQMTGLLALGWIADRCGHRRVIVIGMVASIAMNVVALTAVGVGGFPAVFGLYGVFNAAIQVSALNVALEFAPSAEQRPTYVGIERTLLAPFGFGLPLLGGHLVDVIGYRAVFGLGIVFGIACVVMLFFVRDPRHQRPERLSTTALTTS